MTIEDDNNARMAEAVTTGPSGQILAAEIDSLIVLKGILKNTGIATEVAIQVDRVNNEGVDSWEAVIDGASTVFSGATISAVVYNVFRATGMLITGAKILSNRATAIVGVATGVYVAIDSFINEDGVTNNVKNAFDIVLTKTKQFIESDADIKAAQLPIYIMDASTRSKLVGDVLSSHGKFLHVNDYGIQQTFIYSIQAKNILSNFNIDSTTLPADSYIEVPYGDNDENYYLISDG